MIRLLAALILAFCVTGGGAAGQDTGQDAGSDSGQSSGRSSGQDASAALDLPGSSITLGAPRGWIGRDRPRPVTLRLSVTKPVPYRLFLLDGPPRLVVDLQGLDLSGADSADLFGAHALPALRWGRLKPGWSRLVAELPGPYRVARAGLRAAAARPLIEIVLAPVAAKDFVTLSDASAAMRDVPPLADRADARAGDGRLHVVLDPGHGGFDPGAQAGGETEAALVLGFGQALASALRARGIDVTLTRAEDRFIGLEARMTAARRAGADLFLSLHADALPQGEAAGAAVYVWTPEADDRATRQLAMRHDRDDLLGGMDLGGTDDALAAALMDVARTDTQPRSENFARFLASRMALEGIGMHRMPVRDAGFSVLKSPDIPSALLELGFLTDGRDRANLTDPVWRRRMVNAIVDAVAGWHNDDAARRALLRR